MSATASLSGDDILASRGDLAKILNVSEDSLPDTVFEETELELKTLRNSKNGGDTSLSRVRNASAFLRIDWEPPVVDLLRDNPLPPVKEPRPNTPSADSPYRKNIRPKMLEKTPVSPEKRAKIRIKQMFPMLINQ